VRYFLIFVMGAVIGSFLNVCVYRLPKGRSIVWPGSSCPGCGEKIRPYDNIPIFSYIFLRGRCRFCGMRISARYLLIEILTPLSGLILFKHYMGQSMFFIYWFLTCLLMIIVFIDIEFRIIPDVISLPGIFAGLLVSAFLSGDSIMFSMEGFKDSVLGIIAGGGSILFMGLFGYILFRKEAVGGGDVKLMAMIGSFVGWKLVLLTFFLAPFFGSIIGVYVLVKKKESIIPYAPYLSLAAFISILYGDSIISYLFPYI